MKKLYASLLLSASMMTPQIATAQLSPGFCETLDDAPAGTDAHAHFSQVYTVINCNAKEGDADHPYERSWGLYAYTEGRIYGLNAYLLYPYYQDLGAADDWLITRYVTLEKDKYYQVSLDASLYNDVDTRPQVFEVKYGMTADVEGLRYDAIGRTEVSSARYTHHTAWIKPRVSGRFYIGIHGISPYYDKYYNYLFVDNVALSTARTGAEPVEISGMKFTNDPEGTTLVTIAFKAPDKAIDGSALTSLSKIEVYRGRKLVKTFSSPMPGESLTLTDDPGVEGDVEYRFRPFNSAGEGGEMVAVHRAGIGNPVPPKVTAISEVDGGKKVTLKVEAPMSDIYHNEINPERLTYTVYDMTDETAPVVAEGLKGTELTFETGLGIDSQHMVVYGVSAKINDKVSERAYSPFLPIGRPYDLPYINSFDTSTLDEMITTGGSENVVWRLQGAGANPKAQDGDDAYIAMVGTAPEEHSEMVTGKISLAAATNPSLSFYTYKYEGDENTIDINIIDPATGERTTVEHIDLTDYGIPGWNQIRVDLTPYAGKVIRIGLDATIVTDGYVPVDNIRLINRTSADLSVTGITGTSSAEPNKPFDVTATVFNAGTEKATNYTVVLKCGEVTVDEITGPEVEPLGYVSVKLKGCLGVGASDITIFNAVAEIARDGNPEDNTSPDLKVTLMLPTHPVVKDLALEDTEAGVRLTWSEPNLSDGAGECMTDDFESYDDYASPFGDWSVYDGDGALVGGFLQADGSLIDMPYNDKRASFWIQPALGDFLFIPPFSGDKVVIQMYSYNSDGAVQSDDWLISPELYGGRQTVTFMARSLSEIYGNEVFQMLYSTTGTNPSDFEPLAEEIVVPEEWTSYSFNLPADARYFAVRCISDNCYAFLLDDFSLYPAGKPLERRLSGYNVYRNDMLLTSEPVTDHTYTIASPEKRDRYYVTAVYDLGESSPSNVVIYKADGIATVTDDESEAEYFDLRGYRVDPSRGLPAGIYIERRGHKAVKRVIR